MESKDKKKAVIKTVAISLAKSKTSVKSEVRKKIAEAIVKKAAAEKFDDLLKQVLSDQLQKTTRKEVSKVYPIIRFEVRKMEVLD